MSQRLLIRYRGPGAPVQWLSLDVAGRVLQGPVAGPAPDSAALAAATEIVVLVPAADVLLARAEVPARQREQIERALPFALEDQVLEPVENLHCAWRLEDDGSQSVAAVRHSTLQAWLADLAARGVRPDRMVSEAAALPQADDALAVLVEDGRALIRAGRFDIAAVDAGELEAWLALATEGRGEGTRLLLHDASRASRALSSRVAIERVDAERPVLAWLAPGAAASSTVNLLSGRYAPRHRGQPVARLWRVAGALAGAVLLLALGASWLEHSRIAQRQAALDAQMRTLYRQAFPTAPALSAGGDALRFALERVRSPQGGGGALPLLKRLAPVLTASTQYTIKSMEYRNAVLEVALLADSVATLDGVRERAGSLGLSATLSAVSAGSQGTEGKLRVEVAK